jgi:hypothetical protein
MCFIRDFNYSASEIARNGRISVANLSVWSPLPICTFRNEFGWREWDCLLQRGTWGRYLLIWRPSITTWTGRTPPSGVFLLLYPRHSLYVLKPVSDGPPVHSGHVTVFSIVSRQYLPRPEFSWSRRHFSFRMRGPIVPAVTCYVDGDLMWGSVNILECHGDRISPDGATLWHFSGFSKRCTNTKLRGMSPRANYTDRATAACRRS